MATRGRSQTAKTAIPCIYLFQDEEDAGFNDEFHSWDTIHFKTQHFHYVAGETRVYLDRGEGYYEIIFQCSYNLDRAESNRVFDHIYLNGSAIDGAKCITTYGKVWSQDAQGYNWIDGNNNIHIIQYLKPGDYIQVYANTTYSTDRQADTCRLIIKFIPMEGWNNSSGGRVEYKGGVSR